MECIFNLTGAAPVHIPCNYNNGSENLALGTVVFSEYGYFQAGWTAYTFIAVFGAAWLAQVCWSIIKRPRAASICLAVGTTIECIGWGGRIWSKDSLFWNVNQGGYWDLAFGAFIMQEVCLVIAPVFFSAANYLLFGRLVVNAKGKYCTLAPRTINIMLMTADWVCLVIQAAGGGWAGTASDPAEANNGALMMSAGVIVQLVVSVVFFGLYGEFIYRWRNELPAVKQYDPFAKWHCGRRKSKSSSHPMHQVVEGLQTPSESEKTLGTFVATWPMTSESRQRRPAHLKLALWLMGWTTLLLIVRNVYRSAELINGWTGKLATNQALFTTCDALLMALLSVTYAVVPPAYLST